MDTSYSLTGPHRRPAGKFILSARGRDGFKTRAHYLADNLASTYSHKAGGYVLSPAAARDFEILYAAGFTGAMRFSRDPARFDHDGRRVYKVSRREALKLAAEWAARGTPVMSKNPPKPNTSPDHVKETAEAFTRRERLEKIVRLAAFARGNEGFGGRGRALAEIEGLARDTLLATPTQEGVGREEIERILQKHLRARCDTDSVMRPVQWIDGIYDASVEIASLLPAPKPGEDHGATFDRFRDEALGCQRAQPQQPAPGAPEGWREAQRCGLCQGAGRIKWAADCVGNPAREEACRQCGGSGVVHLAALTSSSAKPVGEGTFTKDSYLQHVTALNDEQSAELEALAQSNRRLREGLEKLLAANDSAAIAMAECGSQAEADKIARIRAEEFSALIEEVRAALKDKADD